MKNWTAFTWAEKLCVAVLLLLGASRSGSAQAVFIEFDAPGAIVTSPIGITSLGTIIGEYTDSENAYHGFVRDSAGNITTFDEPNAAQGAYLGTTPIAINDSGEVAGYYTPISNPSSYVGFIRDAAGNFTSFGVTGMPTTMAYGLSDSGETAGCATQTGYCPYDDGVSEGFVRDSSGAVVTFVPPNASTVWPWAMNASGTVTGFYSDSKFVIHGFVRSASGVITEFDMPHFHGNGTGTLPQSINDSNEIVGWYDDPSLVTRGFIRDAQGKLSRFDVPGTDVYTHPEYVDATGNILGNYSDSAGFHGFLRNPAGKFTTFDAPGAEHQPGRGTLAVGLNQQGVIAGYYVDANLIFHGYLRVP